MGSQDSKDLLRLINNLPQDGFVEVLKYIIQINAQDEERFSLPNNEMGIKVDFCCRKAKHNLTIKHKMLNGHTRSVLGFKGNLFLVTGLQLQTINVKEYRLYLTESLHHRLVKIQKNLTSLD